MKEQLRGEADERPEQAEPTVELEEEVDADIIAVTQEYPPGDFKRLQQLIEKKKLTCSCARGSADCAAGYYAVKRS